VRQSMKAFGPVPLVRMAEQQPGYSWRTALLTARGNAVNLPDANWVLAAVTVILVLVTAYYAWQNHKMVDVLKRQADLSEETERNRRRDAQIVAAVVLHASPPAYSAQWHKLELEVTNPSDSSAVLAPRLVIRAAKEPVGAPLWETPSGAAETSMEIPDALMPGEKGTFRGLLHGFVQVAEAKPGQPPLWPEQLIYDIQTTGVLGQSVLQRYEWRPNPTDGVFVRLRLVEIAPNVEGSRPLRIVPATTTR
jgi:hypothetical protein